MPTFDRGPVHLHYTDTGDPRAPAVLCLAPGGMRSMALAWSRSPYDPRSRLADLRVVAMDQRNAGASRAPVTARDGWASYTDDQLALADHLGLDRFAVVGMCIGCTFAARLARAAPDRIRAAVMLQPIGLHDNRAS